MDGTLAEFGRLDHGSLLQAKGKHYALEALLATPGAAEVYRDGSFATLYLAPCDYHRIHSPLAFRVDEVIHVPGTCFPVFPAAVRQIEALFVQNERVVLLGHEPDSGDPLALIAVAAFGVGNIQLPWLPDIATNRPFPGKVPRRFAVSRPFDRGEEVGTFALGSTVITTLGSPVAWLRDAGPCRMGQDLCRLPEFPGG